MRRLAWLALLLPFGVVALAQGAAPATQSKPTVEQLIEKLASRDFHAREAASKELGALGIAALPALQKARANPDPEVRRRLEELIPPLERALVLMPKRVTLHMTNKPIQDVLNEITKQTGYKLATWGGGAVQVFMMPGVNGAAVPAPPRAEKGKTVFTFHFDNLPFWEALDKVCDAAGLILPQGYWGDDQLHLQPSDSYVPFSCYSGPFKVVATGFNYYRNNNFAQLPRNPAQMAQQNTENLQINLMVAVEPKIPIIRVGAVRVTAAEDDEHNSMLPIGGDNQNGHFGRQYYYGGWGRSYVHQSQATLSWPSKKSHVVRYLKGTIPVTILADQKPGLVTDKVMSAKGKKFKVGEANLHIEDVAEMPGKMYQIKVNFSETNKDNANDWSRVQFLQQRMELTDAKGNKYSFYLNFQNWGGPGGAQFTIHTQPNGNAKMGPPAKLVLYAWNLMEHEVPFEFRDLPLP
jgi:hypothetical protein